MEISQLSSVCPTSLLTIFVRMTPSIVSGFRSAVHASAAGNHGMQRESGRCQWRERFWRRSLRWPAKAETSGWENRLGKNALLYKWKRWRNLFQFHLWMLKGAWHWWQIPGKFSFYLTVETSTTWSKQHHFSLVNWWDTTTIVLFWMGGQSFTSTKFFSTVSREEDCAFCQQQRNPGHPP